MPVSKIQPEYLKAGDEVMIVSPSYCIDDNKLIEGVELLEKWGLRVRIGKNAVKRNGPFAGSDQERLADLQEATDDPAVKAVICSRGGYGVSRIISSVDFSALRKYPKWYVGFSDITVLHLWLSEVCGIMSIHGDMPLNYSNPEMEKPTFVTLNKALFGNLESISWEGEFYREDKIRGEITGGNLSLIYSVTGTPAEPRTKGSILLIEDIGEKIYHIDRMMISLKLSGKLKDLAALVIGGISEIEDTKIPWGRSVEQTILDVVKEYDYPVLFGFPSGHINDNRAFYIGRQAEIDVTGGNAVLSFI